MAAALTAMASGCVSFENSSTPSIVFPDAAGEPFPIGLAKQFGEWPRASSLM